MTQLPNSNPSMNDPVLTALANCFGDLSTAIRALLPMIVQHSNSTTVAQCAQVLAKLEETDRVLNILTNPPSPEEIQKFVALLNEISAQTGDNT